MSELVGFYEKKKTMDAVIDLTILVVVMLIAFKMMRWGGSVRVKDDAPTSKAKLSPVRNKTSVKASDKPGNVLVYDHPDGVSSASDRPLTTGPADSRELTEKSAIAQDELILDADPDGMYSLLSPDLEADISEETADDELILEEEIGLGTVGLPMASRLVQAGFAVTTSPQKWRRDSKRLDLSDLDLDDFGQP